MIADEISQFSFSQLKELYRIAKRQHAWSDNSLAFDFGDLLCANAPEGMQDDEEEDLEHLGEVAISQLLDSGFLELE